MADSTHKFLSVSFFSFLISKLYFKFDGIAKIIAENEFKKWLQVLKEQIKPLTTVKKKNK